MSEQHIPLDGQANFRDLVVMKRPLVFHCSHGVHRTGTGAAILLSALGVPWEAVREDYLLSNAYRHEEVQKRLKQLRQMAAQKQGVEVSEVDMSNMEAFLVQDGSYIDATQDEILVGYGSLADYLKEIEIESLQEELVSDE